MMTDLYPEVIQTAHQYRSMRAITAEELLHTPGFDRGSVHAQKVTQPEMVTRELRYKSLSLQVPQDWGKLMNLLQPNLPWAEDHFQERIGKEPLNPPPSNEWWPYAQSGNADHKGVDQKFSHTYPERFWPRYANTNDAAINHNKGIRFYYGDLEDLVQILNQDPLSRQAYLPVWFPEDLNAARSGERVPCTLGYHMMADPSGRLNMHYMMRSCDFLRFMTDDLYMAARLLQYVSHRVEVAPGKLHTTVSSLHVFEGDVPRLQIMAKDAEEVWEELNLRRVRG